MSTEGGIMKGSSRAIARHWSHFLLCICLGITTSAPAADTTAELRAAADKWLSRDKIKMNYQTADKRWSGSPETNVREGTTYFYVSGNYCLGGAAPTKIEFNGEELVFAFKLPKSCNELQYRFNPITGHGTVYTAPPGTDTWAPSSSSISLSN
jgi:hypothetical protein